MKNWFPVSLLTLLVITGSALDSAVNIAHASKPASSSALTAGKRIDFLFKTIAIGDSIEQSRAIDELFALLHSGDPEVREIAIDYTHDSRPPDFKPRPNRKRCALLLQAIPELIAAVDGNMDGTAYGILIYIQPYNAAPDHETWEKWWKESGRAHFAALAGKS